MSWDFFLDENENEAPLTSAFSMPTLSTPLNDQISDSKLNSNSILLNDDFYVNQKSHSIDTITSNSYTNMPPFEKNSTVPIELPNTDSQTNNDSPLTQRSSSLYAKIQFHPNRVQAAINSNKINLTVGDYVATEADRGYDIGQVVSLFDDIEEISNSSNCPKIIRKAKQQEILFLQDKRQKEENAIKICQEKANELKLPMTITSTEYQFDGKKLTVYFTANTYIDFRKLVNALFRVFGIRIWMVWYDGKAPVRDVFTHNEHSHQNHWK